MTCDFPRGKERILLHYESKGLEDFLSDETARYRDSIKEVCKHHPEVEFIAGCNSAAKFYMSIVQNGALEGVAILLIGKELPLEKALRELYDKIGIQSSCIRPASKMEQVIAPWLPDYTTKRAYEIMKRITQETRSI